eukprot:TRINITY_DN41941_c0_g1_i1.p1 TRINITY_DN41941_c0_g1~~TRINITY_DN41941_c0_g1_i1.p1  ORF type:complete len:366 (-),score=92.01 TRINITY_DN41941_c0_g1_i1:242-1339(-)
MLDDAAAAAPLEELRSVVGPHASDERLEDHLSKRRYDVRQAANCYFREACQEQTGPPFDFQVRLPPVFRPPPAEGKGESAGSAGEKSSSSVVPWLQLEPPCFPAARFLGGWQALRDFSELSAGCRALRQRIASDGCLWEALFQEVFRQPSADFAASLAEMPSLPPNAGYLRPPASTSGGQLLPRFSGGNNGYGLRPPLPLPAIARRDDASVKPKPSAAVAATLESSRCEALERFTARWNAEAARRCPVCGQTQAIVPILYGYPFSCLVTLARGKKAALAENCGLMGACWICNRCRVEWDCHPYSGVSPRSPQQQGWPAASPAKARPQQQSATVAASLRLPVMSTHDMPAVPQEAAGEEREEAPRQ